MLCGTFKQFQSKFIVHLLLYIYLFALKTSATGPIESSPGTFTKEGSHKYLKKGAGSKWRNPSGSIPTKTKSSQLNSAAVVRTNHTEGANILLAVHVLRVLSLVASVVEVDS